MKLNEYGMKCFAAGKEVTVNGKQYRFVVIIPNGYNKCALYSEGQERFGASVENVPVAVAPSLKVR